MSNNLTFNELREANLKRLPQFKDKLGRQCHTIPDGSDWTAGDWMTAIAGEVGELASVVKSLRRGDYANTHTDTIRQYISNEAADIVTYLDIFCHQFQVDLGDAVAQKFNEVSKRIGADVHLREDEYDDSQVNEPTLAQRLAHKRNEDISDMLPAITEKIQEWILANSTKFGHVEISCGSKLIQDSIMEWAANQGLEGSAFSNILQGNIVLLWWDQQPMIWGATHLWVKSTGEVVTKLGAEIE